MALRDAVSRNLGRSIGAIAAMLRAMPITSLFELGPDARRAVVVELDVDHVRPAAHGAILRVRLALAGRRVERHDDLLAARAAHVARFVAQLACSSPSLGHDSGSVGM